MTALRHLPLRRWHEARGAIELGELGGFSVPLHYGDLPAETEALHAGVGLFDRSAFSRLELLGADRTRFLNGLVTCDVHELAAGRGTYGYITEQKAGILADVAVYALEDRFWLDLPPGREAAVRAHLEKYIVADRVEVVALDEMIPLAVLGPQIDPTLERGPLAVAESRGGPDLILDRPWSHARAMLWGSEVRLARHERLGRPGVVVWVSASIADLFADDLLAHVATANGSEIVPVGLAAYDDQRVRSGVGLFGLDFDERTLPQELGEEVGIDYDKGCYLGQEVVARLRYRGQVPRQLRRVVFDQDPGPIELGAEVLYEDRSVGTLTSLSGPRAPRVGLARLARRAFEPGTKVEVAGRGAIVELPAVLEADQV